MISIHMQVIKELLVNKGLMMKKIIFMLAMLSIPLSKAATKTYTATIYNNAKWPIAVWPIPSGAPPKLLTTIPPKREGIVTTPAKIGWPTAAKSVIFVGEPLFGEFNNMLEKMVEESKGNSKYQWTKQISERLEKYPQTKWTMAYHIKVVPAEDAKYVGFNYSHMEFNSYWKDMQIVLFHVIRDMDPRVDLWPLKVGDLMSITAPEDYQLETSSGEKVNNIGELYPSPGYKGIPSK